MPPGCVSLLSPTGHCQVRSPWPCHSSQHQADLALKLPMGSSWWEDGAEASPLSGSTVGQASLCSAKTWGLQRSQSITPGAAASPSRVSRDRALVGAGGTAQRDRRGLTAVSLSWGFEGKFPHSLTCSVVSCHGLNSFWKQKQSSWTWITGRHGCCLQGECFALYKT